MGQDFFKNGRIFIFSISIVFLLSSCSSRSCEKRLFISSFVQDSLELFIKKNQTAIINPYKAPNVCIVTIDEIDKDTVITFMVNINLIEFVAIGDSNEPILEVQGACVQNGMIVVLYGSKEYHNLVNYSCLNLRRKDYDYFYSYKKDCLGFEHFPFSYRRYCFTEKHGLKLKYMMKSSYELN